jgi:hypothetical protein
LQQKLFQLAPDSLRGKIVEVDRSAQRNRVRMNIKLKTSGELRRAQNA